MSGAEGMQHESRYPGLLRTAGRGALAGAAAAIPQAAIGKIGEKLLLPPSEDSNIAPRLVDRVARRFGHRTSYTEEWVLGTAFHFLYGAGWGAAYALAAERLRLRPLVGGLAMGHLIYGITFTPIGGAVLMDVERPPERRTRRMSIVAWSVAVGFGVITALLYGEAGQGEDGGAPERRPNEGPAVR